MMNINTATSSPSRPTRSSVVSSSTSTSTSTTTTTSSTMMSNHRRRTTTPNKNSSIFRGGGDNDDNISGSSSSSDEGQLLLVLAPSDEETYAMDDSNTIDCDNKHLKKQHHQNTNRRRMLFIIKTILASILFLTLTKQSITRIGNHVNTMLIGSGGSSGSSTRTSSGGSSSSSSSESSSGGGGVSKGSRKSDSNSHGVKKGPTTKAATKQQKPASYDEESNKYNTYIASNTLPNVLISESNPISWTMHYPTEDEGSTYTELYNPIYKCMEPTSTSTTSTTYDRRYNDDDIIKRVELPSKSLKHLMNFRTDIYTNLNFLVMGDSVAMQIGELLQESMGIIPNDRELLRELDDQDGELHESLFWGISRNRGYGGSGGWRILNWWLHSNHGKPLPEIPGGGWLLRDVTTLKASIQKYYQQKRRIEGGDKQHDRSLRRHHNTNTPIPLTSIKKPKVDVLIFRISQPWMYWEELFNLEEGLKETIQVAKQYLKIRVAIILTIPFSNNIVTMDDVHNMLQVNELTRIFTKEYNNAKRNIDKDDNNDNVIVLPMEFGQLNDALLFENMKSIGYRNHEEDDDSNSDESTMITNIGYYKDLIYDILYQPKRQFSRSIGQLCGHHRVKKGSFMCQYNNMISYDGQHLCMKTFSGRIFATIACLTKCAYTYTDDALNSLHECSDACNNQYMSLQSIDSSLFI